MKLAATSALVAVLAIGGARIARQAAKLQAAQVIADGIEVLNQPAAIHWPV